jgi:macrolide transport system ATP-binding/permease protein
MSWFPDFWRKQKLERELDKELRFHFEEQVRAHLAAGLPADEARRRASIEFGGFEQIKEGCRDQRRDRWLEEVFQDLRYAVRQLRKDPAFSVAAILTMALGIGVNGALFIAYNAVSLRPLPVHEPETLVRFRQPGNTDTRFSYLEYLDYRAAVQTFSGLAAWRPSSTLIGPAPDDKAVRREVDPSFEVQSERVAIQLVSDNYFSVMGEEIWLGRGFSPDEYRDPNTPVIVLSHLYWSRMFQEDRNVVGRELLVSGRPHMIVGVTAPGFVGHQPAPPAGWIPLPAAFVPELLNSRKSEMLFVIGRLRPAATLPQARAELRHLAEEQRRLQGEERITKDVGRLDLGMKVFQFPWDQLNTKGVSGIAALLLGFAMVLGIACTNVANLLLARGVTRQHEIGVRLTLGASRGRVLRQLLTENLLLCAIAALCGLVLARWSLAYIVANIPPEWGENPGEMRQLNFLQFGLDWRVAVFGAGIAVVAALAAGLMPALYATRSNVVGALKDDGTALGGRLRQSRLRNTLIIVQVSGCMTLLSCAGQLLRNLIAIRSDEPGFNAHGVYYANLRLSGGPVLQPAANSEVRQALQIVESLPGVTAVSLAAGGGIGDSVGQVLIRTPGSTTDAIQGIKYGLTSAGHFATFEIRLAQGRFFSAEDVSSRAPVVVVSEAAAERLWPGQSAIGKTLAVNVSAFGESRRPSSDYRELEVVGVARNVRSNPRSVDSAALFLPLPPDHQNFRVYLRLRRGATLAQNEELQRVASDRGVGLSVGGSVKHRLDFALVPFRYLAWLSGILGGLALVTAIVGLYGVMAFTVNQRIREIGIRIALGATAGRVIRLFVRQGVFLVGIGVGVGLVGGGLFAIIAGKITFGLRNALDPVAFISVTALLVLAGTLACWLPSRRATKVDPMVALRAE